MAPLVQETNWGITPNWIRKRQVIGQVAGIVADPEDNAQAGAQPAQTGMNEVRNNLTGQPNVAEGDAIVNNGAQVQQGQGQQVQQVQQSQPIQQNQVQQGSDKPAF